MLNKHLNSCPDCRRMADQMAHKDNEIKQAFSARLTLAEREDLKAQVLARIKEMEPEPRP